MFIRPVLGGGLSPIGTEGILSWPMAEAASPGSGSTIFAKGIRPTAGQTYQDKMIGYIDQVITYKKALTKVEIEQLYNSGSGVTYAAAASNLKDSDMVQWWEMNETPTDGATTRRESETLDEFGRTFDWRPLNYSSPGDIASPLGRAAESLNAATNYHYFSTPAVVDPMDTKQQCDSLFGAHDFSAVVWFKNTVNSTEGCIMSAGSEGSFASNQATYGGYCITCMASGDATYPSKLKLEMIKPNALSVTQSIYTAPSYGTAGWHMAAMRYVHSTQLISISLDGV